MSALRTRSFAVTLGALGVLFALAAWASHGTLGDHPAVPALGFASLLGLGVAVVLLRTELARLVRSPSFIRELSGVLLVVLTALIGLGVFSWTRSHDWTVDLTERRSFSLSSQGQAVCEGLSDAVSIEGFFPGGTANAKSFEDLARAIHEDCPSLKVSLLDPVVHPRKARAAGAVTDQGLAVMSTSDGREERLEGLIDEARLLQGLMRLQAETRHRVCWVTGHGEASPFDEVDAGAMGSVVRALQAWNYDVVSLQTVTTGVPTDCDLVVIARPQQDGLPFEREALAAFIGQGGRALVMVDLVDHDPVPEFTKDLGRYGVDVGTDLIVDLNPENQMLGVNDPAFVVLTGENLSLHRITSSLNGAVVFGVARSVSPREGAAGLNVQTVLKTSPQAWAETDLDPSSEVNQDPEELAGEVPTMVAVTVVDPHVLEVKTEDAPVISNEPDPLGLESDVGRAVPEGWAPKAGGRLLVIGDSDFASNGLSRFGSNRDLFLNGVAWLVDEERQMGARTPRLELLELTAFSGSTLVLVSLLLLPGCATLGALIAWLRRRPR